MIRSSTKGIVLHRAEVWNGKDYHFIIQTNGSIFPLVPLTDKGEHAIAYNDETVAIATFGDFASLEPGKNNKPTEAQLSSCVLLMQLINSMYGGRLWACGHSQLGTRGTSVPLKLQLGHTCPGEYFPLADIIKRSGLTSFFK